MVAKSIDVNQIRCQIAFNTDENEAVGDKPKTG